MSIAHKSTLLAIVRTAQSNSRVVSPPGSGGGWGDPKERDHDAVLADLRSELISESTAREIYGLSDADLAMR